MPHEQYRNLVGSHQFALVSRLLRHSTNLSIFTPSPRDIDRSCPNDPLMSRPRLLFLFLATILARIAGFELKFELSLLA